MKKKRVSLAWALTKTGLAHYPETAIAFDRCSWKTYRDVMHEYRESLNNTYFNFEADGAKSIWCIDISNYRIPMLQYSRGGVNVYYEVERTVKDLEKLEGRGVDLKRIAERLISIPVVMEKPHETY